MDKIEEIFEIPFDTVSHMGFENLMRWMHEHPGYAMVEIEDITTNYDYLTLTYKCVFVKIPSATQG